MKAVSSRGEAGVEVLSWKDSTLTACEDRVAVEEPLEVYVDGALSLVTMRTPGREKELAAGYCFSEALIDSRRDIGLIAYCGEEEGNRVDVILEPERRAAKGVVAKDSSSLTYSSCGICGKKMVDETSLRLALRASTFTIPAQRAGDLLETLERCQECFGKTGGTHAAGLFNREMELLGFAEDIGRHNAFDKALGEVLLADRLDDVLVAVLTSRLSYEMVLRAGRSKAEVLIGMSSPTSLGVELANRLNLTVVGFARQGRLNVYSGVNRITAGV
jgi:FdhD protein